MNIIIWLLIGYYKVLNFIMYFDKIFVLRLEMLIELKIYKVLNIIFRIKNVNC